MKVSKDNIKTVQERYESAPTVQDGPLALQNRDAVDRWNKDEELPQRRHTHCRATQSSSIKIGEAGISSTRFG